MPIRGTGAVQPTTDNVLSEAVMGYSNDEYQLQKRVLPLIQTPKRKGSYWKFGKESFNDEAEYIGSEGESPRLTRSLTEETFTLKPVGAAVELSWDTNDEASPVIMDLLDNAEYVTDKILLKLERVIGTALVTTSNWTTTVAIASGSEWNSAGGGSPIAIFNTAGLAIRQLIGKRIDELTIVLPYEVAQCLRFHPELRDYIKFMDGNPPSIVTEEMMARIFGYKQVIVSSAMYNTALKNLTASLSGLMSDTAWVGYVTGRPALMRPNAGYSLALRYEKMIRSYIESKNRRDVIDGVKHIGVEISAPDAGYTITNCLA